MEEGNLIIEQKKGIFKKCFDNTIELLWKLEDEISISPSKPIRSMWLHGLTEADNFLVLLKKVKLQSEGKIFDYSLQLDYGETIMIKEILRAVGFLMKKNYGIENPEEIIESIIDKTEL